MYVLCLLYFAAFTRIFAAERPKSRIVGGQAVSIESFPFQLAIIVDDQVTCSASLLSPNIGISAAHCFNEGHVYKVRAGSTSSIQGGVLVVIREVVLHPKYNRDTHDYDICVLHLRRSLQYSKFIQPVKLPQHKETIPENLMGYASGWGSTYWYKPITKIILRAVEVPVVDWHYCRVLYPPGAITRRMFCAGYVEEGGKDACQGDSGGPYTVNGVLVGIVSWGYSCAQPGYPGVYTNVGLFTDFIKEAAGL